MNFFGHVVVATWLPDADGRTALGAMLPDLLGIAGLRGVEPRDPEVARGLELHHRTDDVFHASDAFVTLQASLRAALEAGGLQGGPARAVAHVGVELLLDGALLDGIDLDGGARVTPRLEGVAVDGATHAGAAHGGPSPSDAADAGNAWPGASAARAAFLSALEAASEPLLKFRDADARDRFSAFAARARALGVPEGYREPAFVRDRVVGALARRPRLAVPAAAVPAVGAALADLRPAVVEAAPAWLRALRERLTR